VDVGWAEQWEIFYSKFWLSENCPKIFLSEKCHPKNLAQKNAFWGNLGKKSKF